MPQSPFRFTPTFSKPVVVSKTATEFIHFPKEKLEASLKAFASSEALIAAMRNYIKVARVNPPLVSDSRDIELRREIMRMSEKLFPYKEVVDQLFMIDVIETLFQSLEDEET